MEASRPSRTRCAGSNRTRARCTASSSAFAFPGAPGEQFAWVVATNVYLKSAQGWRLVAHHASPGAAEAPEAAAEPGSTLH